MQRMASWAGSEELRREQGVCRPPVSEPFRVPRFTIQAGQRCHIKPVEAMDWRPYKTTKPLGFDRYEAKDGKQLIFRDQGYQLRIAPHLVRCNVTVHKRPRVAAGSSQSATASSGPWGRNNGRNDPELSRPRRKRSWPKTPRRS
jgi:hypothetical protein